MDRQFIDQLLKILEKENNYVSGELLSFKMNVSSRTIRNKIKESNEILMSNGLEIISKISKGYKIKINDRIQYQEFKCQLHNQQNKMFTPQEREQYILEKLLLSSDYIKIVDLEEELYVSKYTLSQDIKEIKNKLSIFNLCLQNRPYYGIKIIGNEMNKRSCLVYYLEQKEIKNNKVKNQFDIDMKIIEEKVKAILNKYHFQLTDIGFHNLIIHIFLGIHRNSNKSTPYELDIDRKQIEFQIASDIVQAINESFMIILPKIETDYITIHLLGKKLLTPESNYSIIPETQDILEEIIQVIKDNYHYDFSDDIDLYTLLLLHLQPMFHRIKYCMVVSNPLLDDIISHSQKAFEIALLAREVIEKRTGYDVSVQEAGYLALHFELAIERYNEPIQKKNILVVCASGRGTSQIVLRQIKSQFYNRINTIQSTDTTNLLMLNLDEYDLIISTVPLNIETKIKVIYIQYFMKKKDLNIISEAFQELDKKEDGIFDCFNEKAFFTNIEAENKEEALFKILNQLKKSFEIPDNLYEQIMQRENVYSTEYGKNCALPHPIIPCFSRNLIVVTVLKKPIIWNKKKVKYIFLLLFKKNDEDSDTFNDILTILIQNDNILSKLDNNLNFKTFISFIKDIDKVIPNKNKEDIFDY